VSRLVFRILGGQSGGMAAWETQLEEPPVLGRRPAPFACSGTEPEFTALSGSVFAAEEIKDAGRRLFDAVVANPDLAPHLTAALQVQQPQRYPVFVELATTGAESLPWEAMCSPAGDFLALDERWAVGRMVDSLSPLEPVWRFAPPLRIAAVLSALGVPANGEWEALRAACAKANLPLDVLVLVSEESLEDKIRKHTPAWATVEFVPPTVSELQQRLRAFQPHVLHLFCHGSAADESPHLQIATKPDWLGAATSSLLVEANEVRDFTARTDNLPWLVVLNCCETATAVAEDTQSVALSLVYEGGIPAVVGMREPVRSDDATLFTEAFYEQLLPELEQRVGGGAAGGSPLDWPMLAVEARRRLVKRHHGLLNKAGAGKAWTLPVVYTRPLSFAFQPAPAPPAGPPPPAPAPEAGPPRRLKLRIEALTGFRAQVEASGDDALLADIDAELTELHVLLEAQ